MNEDEKKRAVKQAMRDNLELILNDPDWYYPALNQIKVEITQICGEDDSVKIVRGFWVNNP